MSQPKQSALGVLNVLLRGTCVWYTAISVCVLMINLLFAGSEHGYVDPLSFLLFLPFSLALTAAGMIRRAATLSAALRIFLHPVLSLGGFYLCIFLLYQINRKPSAGVVLAGLVLIAVIYGIIMAILALLTRRKQQKQIEAIPYQSQFGRKS